MKNLLLIGAGRSSSSLIHYLLEKSNTYDWKLTVADENYDLALAKVGGHPHGQAAILNIHNKEALNGMVAKHDIVVSLLPASLHYHVAAVCLENNRHLITASYVSPQLSALDSRVRSRNLVFMNEIGLDPGIDHMSAMEIIHSIKDQGGTITNFRSYTGGLIAPESDTNPWHYKFTWNPRNVVLAGQTGAMSQQNNKIRLTPYSRLFQSYETIEFPGLGKYEVYGNRDSLHYKHLYGLDDIPSIFRGTIRSQGFCDAWQSLIQLGLTDNSYQIDDADNLTYADLLHALLPHPFHKGNIRQDVARFLQLNDNHEVIDKIEWLGLFSTRKIGLRLVSPAEILEALLLKKWKLEPNDKDIILMQHDISYSLHGVSKRIMSSLVYKGKNAQETAMANLVGLPLGIFVRLLLEGKVNPIGVQIPVTKQVYQPVLEELKTFGVEFKEAQFSA